MDFAETFREPGGTRFLRNREKLFECRCAKTPIPTYNSLYDKDLRHYWGNPHVKRHLKKLGFVDDQERVIDLDLYRRKLHVIEQELKHADRIEKDRLKDKERKMRDRAILGKRMESEERRLQEQRKLKDIRKQRQQQTIERNERLFGLSQSGTNAAAGSGWRAQSAPPTANTIS